MHRCDGGSWNGRAAVSNLSFQRFAHSVCGVSFLMSLNPFPVRFRKPKVPAPIVFSSKLFRYFKRLSNNGGFFAALRNNFKVYLITIGEEG